MFQSLSRILEVITQVVSSLELKVTGDHSFECCRYLHMPPSDQRTQVPRIIRFFFTIVADIYEYFFNFQKMRKRKHPSDEEMHVKEKLKRLCYKNFDEVFREVSEDDLRREKQLALYTLLLHEALKCQDEEQLDMLSDHLSSFLQFIVSILKLF